MIQNISQIPEQCIIRTFKIDEIFLVMCYVDKSRKIAILKQQNNHVSQLLTTRDLESAEQTFDKNVEMLKWLFNV